MRYQGNVLRLATIEEQCIKLWECENGFLRTVKKLKVKQKLIDAVSQEMIGFLIILGRNGSVLILNSSGSYVSTIERPEIEFTSLSCSGENLYLGTFNGSVLNYHISSL